MSVETQDSIERLFMSGGGESENSGCGDVGAEQSDVTDVLFCNQVNKPFSSQNKLTGGFLWKRFPQQSKPSSVSHLMCFHFAL